MDVQEEINAIIAEAKAWKWTPELFERIKAILPYANIFNALRWQLTPDEYAQFDLEYCEYVRPGQRELTKWVRKRGEKEKWRKKKAELLQRKKQLLTQKSQR